MRCTCRAPDGARHLLRKYDRLATMAMAIEVKRSLRKPAGDIMTNLTQSKN